MLIDQKMIRDLPKGERPRERLLAQGSAALSDAELLAVLLRTGKVGIPATQLAFDLLHELGGLPGLLGATPQLLQSCGVGPAKAASVLAAVEIGRRLGRFELPERAPLTRPGEVARYLALRYRLRDQEVVGALFLDGRNRLLAEREVFRGTLLRTAVEPREILKDALLRGAAGIVVFHTHPSGDPSPSAEDHLFTRRLEDAGAVVGVRLVDHLILGCTGRWVSLRQKSAW